MLEKTYYTYILMNKWNTTTYIGITNDLFGRVQQHKEKVNKGFTQKYNINKLVYYEMFEIVEEAIKREKQIKCWSRKKKVNLIKKNNPEFKDLYKEWEV